MAQSPAAYPIQTLARPGVTWRSMVRASPRRSALPKSPSFQVPHSVRNTFSLLMSRCTMP